MLYYIDFSFGLKRSEQNGCLFSPSVTGVEQAPVQLEKRCGDSDNTEIGKLLLHIHLSYHIPYP